MATGGKKHSFKKTDTEDSGYYSVREGQQKGKDAYPSNDSSTQMQAVKAVKAMNAQLREKVIYLEQKIYDKEYEKMTILRNHKRETDALKKRHEKAVDDQSQENKKQSDEIRQLKATIESLEKTIRDLKARLDIARKKYNKEEIKRLKERISRLEEEKAEKKTAFENLKKKYTRDLQAVEYNLSCKMADMKSDLSDQMAEIHNNLEMLILHNQGQNTRVGKE